MPGHPDVESEASRFVKVRAIDLGALVMHAREQVGELGYVIVKMDIEGAEFLYVNAFYYSQGLVFLLFNTVFTTLLRTSGM